MPALTYDGRSFLLSGRRFWIVSGGVHYARIPRELWRDRIHAAKLAGLNTIETPVFWSLHEPVQGQFNFKGEADLRHFVQLVQREGMYVILRPGPFVGMGWDFGGLPTWMARQPGGTLPHRHLATQAGRALLHDECLRAFGTGIGNHQHEFRGRAQDHHRLAIGLRRVVGEFAPQHGGEAALPALVGRD